MRAADDTYSGKRKPSVEVSVQGVSLTVFTTATGASCYRYRIAIGRTVEVEAGLTHIRVHELASELSVGTHEVLSFVEELGKKVRGPSTVIGVSVAAKVRSRFRATRSPDIGADRPAANAPRPVNTPPAATTSRPPATSRPTAADGQSLFLPPVAAPTAAGFSAGTNPFVDPFAVPDAGPAFRAPAQRAPAPAPRAELPRPLTAVLPVVAAPVEDFDGLWRHRGFDQEAQQLWCGSGIRPQDAALADQCRLIGIEPTDLPRKLSGRTVLQRLRDGESTTSVWARIQEAEQQPRRTGTKLTGRFQLS